MQKFRAIILKKLNKYIIYLKKNFNDISLSFKAIKWLIELKDILKKFLNSSKKISKILKKIIILINNSKNK